MKDGDPFDLVKLKDQLLRTAEEKYVTKFCILSDMAGPTCLNFGLTLSVRTFVIPPGFSYRDLANHITAQGDVFAFYSYEPRKAFHFSADKIRYAVTKNPYVETGFDIYEIAKGYSGCGESGTSGIPTAR